MLWRRIAIGAGAVMALLLLVIAGGYVWLDTQSGRNFVARQIAAFEMENGLNIRSGLIGTRCRIFPAA
jgi:translocation and assembly module TamB